jgi:hypothetical protein
VCCTQIGDQECWEFVVKLQNSGRTPDTDAVRGSFANETRRKQSFDVSGDGCSGQTRDFTERAASRHTSVANELKEMPGAGR